MRPVRVAVVFALAVASAALVLCAQSGRAGGTPGQRAPVSQPVPIGTGLITGQAIDALSGAALGGVIVTIAGSARIAPAGQPASAASRGRGSIASIPARRQLTDDQGHFVFTDLPPGSFNITASRPGYADGAYNRSRPNGQPEVIVLGDGQALGNIKIGLWKLGSIGGIVVDEAGEPLVRVQLRALRRTYQAGFARFAPFYGNSASTTDDRGVYRISGLLPGDYAVAIVTSETTIPLAATAEYDAAIRAGGPAADAARQQIENSNAPYPNSGGTRVGDVLLQPPQPGFALPDPGDDGKVVTYATVYYPAADSPLRGTLISVDAGMEKLGVDFHMKATRTVSVSGRVTGPDGAAVNLGLRLISAGADDLTQLDGFETAKTLTAPDGHFTFLGVPPGAYVLRATVVPRPTQMSFTTATTVVNGRVTMSTGVQRGAQPPPLPQIPMLWASAPIAVDDTDVKGIDVTLRRGFHISGYAAFEGSTPRPTADRFRTIPVTIETADNRQASLNGNQPMGRFDDQGQFTSTEVLPGIYFVRIGGSPAGWTFKSATYNGRDIADVAVDLDSDLTGVVITFTDQQTTLQGNVRDSTGTADAKATVIVFPTDSTRWVGYGVNPRRIKSAHASTDGVFRFGALPAGDYFIAAIPDDVASDWQDPRFLEALSRVASRLLLRDGDKKTQDLQTVRPTQVGR